MIKKIQGVIDDYVCGCCDKAGVDELCGDKYSSFVDDVVVAI